jgi:hypothetical protein
MATQTIAGRLPPGLSLTLSGRLHDIGSGLTTVALLGAALLSLRAIHQRQSRQRTSALLIFAACCDIALLAVGGARAAPDSLGLPLAAHLPLGHAPAAEHRLTRSQRPGPDST